MELNVSTIRAATPKEMDYKLSDEKGLFLLVKTNGAKYWRMKYRYQGKEKLLALGVLPDVTLAQVRILCEQHRATLRNDIDPAAKRKEAKQLEKNADANCVKALAEEWQIQRGEMSDSENIRIKRTLERDLIPFIGNLPVNEITAPQLLVALRNIEARGVISSAHKAKQYASQIFRYAIACGMAERNPAPIFKAH